MVWRSNGCKGLLCSTTWTFLKGSLGSHLDHGDGIFQRWKETKAINTLDHQLQWFREEFPREGWILDKIDLVGGPIDVVQSIQMGIACTISDGSFKDFQGAAGFSIICRRTGSSFKGHHTV
jgi:hypothetical protein